MNNSKNELLEFLGGLIMFIAGIIILSQKVIVYSSIFGGGLMIGRMSLNSGLIVVPLIVGIVWMFATSASFPSKIMTAVGVLVIIVSIIMSTNIVLRPVSLYEWILILVLIVGGVGLLAKTLFAKNGNSNKSNAGGNNSKTNYDKEIKSVEQELEELRKKTK